MEAKAGEDEELPGDPHADIKEALVEEQALEKDLDALEEQAEQLQADRDRRQKILREEESHAAMHQPGLKPGLPPGASRR